MYKDKKVVFSGVQPSGVLTIGNYLGAIRNFSAFSDEYRCYYCVVDEHAITVRQNPAELRRRTYETLALYIACGLDPEKNVLFVQSHVSGHAELGWILDCYTMFGELSRMTQFKDKSAKNADNINAGLFTYPALMAADILLYQTELVPVGDDQKQHLELARNIAQRFNHLHGDTFVVPEPFINKTPAARIMSLAEPTKKMSKSAENIHSRISLLDEPSKIKKSIMKATTDSEGIVKFDIENKPGISNLLSIYSALSGKSIEELEAMYEGKGYGDFKKDLAEITVNALAPIKERYEEIRHSEELIEILKDGAARANAISVKTMERVKKNFGLGL